MIETKFEYEMTERMVIATEKVAKELATLNRARETMVFTKEELEDILTGLEEARDTYETILCMGDSDFDNTEIGKLNTRTNALMDKINKYLG